MTPFDRAHQLAWWSRDRPAPMEVVPGVWAFAAPIPGDGPLPWTISYALLSDDDVHLIDPGWGSKENIAALTASLEHIGSDMGRVRSVIATHYHADHLGLCARIRELSGARLILSAVERRVLAQETSPARLDERAHEERLDAWGVPHDRRAEMLRHFSRPSLLSDTEPDLLVRDGGTLELGAHRLRVIATPGHSDGHVCFADEEREILYSGDHVLPEIHAGIALGTLPGGDPLANYLSSLDKLAPWDGHLVLPGHGYVFEGLHERRAETVGHHVRRAQEVAELLDELGDATAWEYARRLTWSGGWDGLSGFTLVSALRQTGLHLEFVRSGRAAPYFALLDS